MKGLNLMLLAGLTACAAPVPPPPVIQYKDVQVRLPDAMLSCAPDPTVPTTQDSGAQANYVIELWQAGMDCRAHLLAVKKSLGQ